LELVGKAHALFIDRTHLTDWKSEAIAAIRDGDLSYGDVLTLFDDKSLADELFIAAGVPLERTP
jgi:hypothetical protein